MTVLRQISIFCQKIMFLEFWQKLCQNFEQFRTETFWRTCSTSWTWPLNLTFWPFLTVFDPFWPFENMKNNYNDTTHRISGQNCTEPPATSYIQKNIDKCFHPEQLAWPVYLVLTVILCKSIKWGRIFYTSCSRWKTSIFSICTWPLALSCLHEVAVHFTCTLT